MEFCEKLQALRKDRGLTQEELADALYVSRTAVSKWESGRGYPSIDSMKGISKFFSVSIDELLSGEKLLSIAETESKSKVRSLCGLLMGLTDLFTLMLIVLPLYPKKIDGYVYAVNLTAYSEVAVRNLAVYWIIFLSLAAAGAIKILLVYGKVGKKQDIVTVCSLALGAMAVMVLALAGETYAVTVVFSLLLIKIILLFRQIKTDN